MRIFAALMVLGGIVAPAPGGGAWSAELVMFESAGCVWCEAWDEEIGGVYPLTAEARIAPLRRVDHDEEPPEDLSGIRPVIYTPTFVLIENGREVGRILGYPGEEHFWGLLGIELEKIGWSPQS
jgi:hypothetical protein